MGVTEGLLFRVGGVKLSFSACMDNDTSSKTYAYQVGGWWGANCCRWGELFPNFPSRTAQASYVQTSQQGFYSASNPEQLTCSLLTEGQTDNQGGSEECGTNPSETTVEVNANNQMII